MFGYTVLFNILFTVCLTYLNRKSFSLKFFLKIDLYIHTQPKIKRANKLCSRFLYPSALGKRQAVVSKEELKDKDMRRKSENVVVELRQYLQHSDSVAGL